MIWRFRSSAVDWCHESGRSSHRGCYVEPKICSWRPSWLNRQRPTQAGRRRRSDGKRQHERTGIRTNYARNFAFPAFGVDGVTRRWEAIDCAAFAADHEIFSHWLLPSALTSLLLDAFNDDWRVRHTYKSSGEAPGRIRFEGSPYQNRPCE